MTIANIQDYRSNAARKLAPAAAPSKPTPTTIAAVPAETEARGFALYLGVDEATARAHGTNLAEIANALKKTFAELVPTAADQTFAAVAIAPKGAGGKNVDVVRTALRDPRAIDKLVSVNDDEAAKGISIDLNRKRVYRNGINADFTNKEFALLAHLVENEGEVFSREDLINVITDADESEVPNDRTIDVHVRRLRAKIEGYEDIIRTIRGKGYTFEKHPDVLIEG
ncbi:MAG: winged helix-turn-helix transcriptional regulator [Rhodoluna sp.]|nr:winged helix-turn-helix transcriptional regulator [Rhodoluna sp.]